MPCAPSLFDGNRTYALGSLGPVAAQRQVAFSAGHLQAVRATERVQMAGRGGRESSRGTEDMQPYALCV